MAQPPYKKATKASQIKLSQNKGTKLNKDLLLGDPIVNTKQNTKKAKATGQTDNIYGNDIQIYEFVLEGLPNPPDLEGMDEDRLFELKEMYKSNCTREMKKEKEILQRELKNLRKNLTS